MIGEQKGTMKSGYRAVAALSVLLIGSGVVWGDGVGDTLGRSEEWEKAAINREWAAANQQTEAELLLNQAVVFAREARDDTLDITTRSSNLVKAGDLRKSAGALYGATVGNLDRAADNWDKASSGFQKLGLRERERNAQDRSVESRGNATRSCDLAAQAYETAAEAYEHNLAGQSASAAVASEKAATWREKLAGRK